MSKLACQCGHIMVVHTMEEDFLYDLISQRKIMDLFNKWDELGDKFDSEAFFSEYNQFRSDVYKCPECGRLSVEEPPGSNQFSSYIKETK
ncbi:hypothetical protein FS594_10965 [Rahnella aquatilis]|nr:hypothetical protein FS594_10965 [Rahnella aquatilis]